MALKKLPQLVQQKIKVIIIVYLLPHTYKVWFLHQINIIGL